MPGARRTLAEGLHDGALRVRLAAPPVDGKANEALREWLAGQLQLRRNQVTLRLGAGSRRKLVEIDAPAAQVAQWLHGLGLPQPVLQALPADRRKSAAP